MRLVLWREQYTGVLERFPADRVALGAALALPRTARIRLGDSPLATRRRRLSRRLSLYLDAGGDLRNARRQGTSSSESSESEESSSVLRAPMCAPAGGACFFSIFCLCSAIESAVFRSRPAGAPLAFDLASWLFACPSRPARAARGTSSSDEELIGLTTRVSCAAPNELQLNTEYRPFQSSGAKVTQIGDRRGL